MYRVRTTLSGPGGPYLSTMYFRVAALGNATEAQNAATAVGNFWNAVDFELSNTVTWVTQAEVAQVNEVTGDVVDAWAVTTQTGTGAKTGDILPTMNQALVRWNTNSFINGRRVQGRTYVPGMTEINNTVTGGPNGSVTGLLGTAAAALIADANSELVVWSRRNGVIRTVTSGTPLTTYAVLRSRRS